MKRPSYLATIVVFALLILPAAWVRTSGEEKPGAAARAVWAQARRVRLEDERALPNGERERRRLPSLRLQAA